MTSEVKICNRAAVLLGAERIISISPPNDAEFAYICAEIYDEVRDDILRSHPWNFAIKRASLTQDVETPAWGYGYQYSIPADCLRVLEMDNVVTGHAGFPWEIESGKLLTDANTPLYIRYIWRNTDPNTYDPTAVTLIAARLAIEAVERITQSNTKSEKAERLYKATLNSAKMLDALEGSQQVFEEDDWLTSRI